MNEKKMNEGTIDYCRRIADLVDKHKGNYDLTLTDIVALKNYFAETKDVTELIRLVYNVGFYEGIGYQSAYAKQQEERVKEQEKKRAAQSEENETEEEKETESKPKKKSKKK